MWISLFVFSGWIFFTPLCSIWVFVVSRGCFILLSLLFISIVSLLAISWCCSLSFHR